MRAIENLGRESDAVKAFFAYARERHSIYLRRVDGQPWPWTDDPILREYRFCNVFRESDTVTQWIRKNIREPYADHPNLWIMLAIARTINWPPTLEYVMTWPHAWPGHEEFSPTCLGDALEERRGLGEKVYTGAYMIRAESDPAKPWYNWSKQRYIAEIVIGRLWEDRSLWERALSGIPPKHDDVLWEEGGEPHYSPLSMEKIWERFQRPRYIGWGPFMAYEVVTDMRHTRYLRDVPDIMTWANAGPGAKRGLNRIWGRSVKSPLPDDYALDEMEALLDTSQSNDFWPQDWPRWEMRDVEHTLCEWDKYKRVRLGQGRPRAKYVQGRGW